MSETEIKLF